MIKTALILFAHGARDARWATPFLRLQKITKESRPDLRVELAYLELMTPQLPELVRELVADGIEKITIAPIFLGQGGHVQRDLPQIITELRIQFPQLEIQVLEAVGEDMLVLHAIRDYCLRMLP